MKKIISLLLITLIALCLFGCQSSKETTSKEVADSIADISADEEGNVMVTLVNGKSF